MLAQPVSAVDRSSGLGGEERRQCGWVVDKGPFERIEFLAVIALNVAVGVVRIRPARRQLNDGEQDRMLRPALFLGPRFLRARESATQERQNDEAAAKVVGHGLDSLHFRVHPRRDSPPGPGTISCFRYTHPNRFDRGGWRKLRHDSWQPSYANRRRRRLGVNRLYALQGAVLRCACRIRPVTRVT